MGGGPSGGAAQSATSAYVLEGPAQQLCTELQQKGPTNSLMCAGTSLQLHVCTHTLQALVGGP